MPFEERVRMSQADETPCPNCGGTHTKRKLPRISIKGQTTYASAPTPASGGL